MVFFYGASLGHSDVRGRASAIKYLGFSDELYCYVRFLREQVL